MGLFFSMLLAAVMQATPPPPPPSLTPGPSPSPATAASALPSPAPSVSPPALSVSQTAVNINPSQSQTLSIQSGTGPYTASVDTPIVSVTIDQAARTLTVTASQQTGHAVLTVTDSTGASVQIPAHVAFNAGSVPPAITLRVTGTQLDTQWLTLQVQKVLLQQAQLQQGATAQVQAFTLPPSLGPGAVATVPVQVQMTGGDQYLDVTPTVNVNLQNVAVAPFSAPLLMYDDDPEKLTALGVLFRGQVTVQTPSRLYYYHENDNTGQARELAVVLSANAPSTVQLIDASAGPNIDVMTVGHTVSKDFLLEQPPGEGIVVDVGAQTPYVADWFTMNRLDGVAGSMGIRVLGGAPVTVTVLAVPPGGLSAAQLPAALAGAQLPDDGHHRTGIFSLVNFGTETVTYTTPGPDADVQYGAQTPPAADGQSQSLPTGHDYGEYGVLRVLNFDINNALDQPQTLYLYERPMGGVVRSSFLVNGTLVQVGCARVSNRYQIGDPVTVQPHANMRLPVETMTDGGSNYPLEVGITASAPLPAVPPINAPDGCFPKPQASAATPLPSPSPAPEPTGKQTDATPL